MIPMKHQYILSIFLLLVLTDSKLSLAQNTIGTTINNSNSNNGLTLISPTSNETNYTYLINNCGQIINQWSSDFSAQGGDIITSNGELYRGAIDNQSTLIYAGNNGRLEKFDWEGNLIWGLTYSDTDFSFHHDFFVLPNGNILLLVAERIGLEMAISLGRNPETLIQSDLYTEKIVEIAPNDDGEFPIVWEWNLIDHLIQDFDNTKLNFGDVSSNYSKLDINHIGFSSSNADWTHLNSIDYNVELDQILISSRFMNEIYIIDHSTTTEEASTSNGGNSNSGGDFLYRWGNPQAYKTGTSDDQILYGQHTAHWVKLNNEYTGEIMMFNNGFNRGYSNIASIIPPLNSESTYNKEDNQPYEPENADSRFEDSPQEDFFAPFLSSAYFLDNGNLLIDNGPIGQLMEVTPEGEIAWKYISPVTIEQGTLSQGDNPAGINSRFFRARQYPESYAGFQGRDLTPGDPIELNPIPENCATLSIINNNTINPLSIYPNPVSKKIYINTDIDNLSYSIYNLLGKKIIEKQNTKSIDVSHLSNGMYIFIAELGEKRESISFIKK